MSENSDDIKTEYVGSGRNAEQQKNRNMVRCDNCFLEYDESINDKCPECGFIPGTPPKVNCHLYPGTILYDRYAIGTVEGFGGFGVTYRAWDNKLGIPVAVKEYFNNKVLRRIPGESNAEIQSGKEQQYEKEMERFLLEAKYTAQFRDYPEFVEVYDIFRANGTAYMVMELLHGCTLLQKMHDNGGRISWEYAADIMKKVADAAGRLHESGIVHNDISPDNIYICNNGDVKLLDFGAADFPDAEWSEEKRLKPGFAPPEQYNAECRTDCRSDVYALSATAYYAMTGELPDESTSRIYEDKQLPASKYNEDIPTYIDKALKRGMDTDRRLRFRTANEFRRALNGKGRIADSEQIIKFRKIMRTALLALFVILFCFTVVFLGKKYTEKKNRAFLTDTSIEVWIPVRDDDKDSITIYSDMSREFVTDYPQVEVVIKAVPEKEYGTMINESIEIGDEGPSLILKCTTGSAAVRAADISDIYEFINKEDYVFFDESNLFSIPLGFNVPVIYDNSSMLDEEQKNEITGDIDVFLSGGKKLYIGTVTDYQNIQKKLIGSYIMLQPSESYKIMCYTDEWMVNDNISEEKKNASIRLLSYWLGETSQDIMHIQNRKSLPVNRNELDIYTQVNGEMAQYLDGWTGRWVSQDEFKIMLTDMSDKNESGELIDNE